MSKTIKEIYGEELIKNPETSLLKHYNTVLNKTPDDLSVDDICLLIRQEFFLKTAIPKAIEILKKDHSAGDNYKYCLLFNLSNINSSLKQYKDGISTLINILEIDFKNIVFDLEDDKKDYLESIKRLKEKIK